MKQYLLTAIAAALEAGRAIREVYQSDFAVEHKKDQSPLTLADKRSHEIIESRLRVFNLPILSEEGQEVPYEVRSQWETLWIVDPLDGTKEFVKRNGEFTVNIALVTAGEPVIGVIYIPARDVLYFAEQNMGAFKLIDAKVVQSHQDGLAGLVAESLALPVNTTASSNSYTIVGSRSHATEALENFVEEKRKEYGGVNFISAGSSLKICLVAEGSADIYPRLAPTMEWDTAAGQAIAEAAGAKVVCYDTGSALTYNREELRNPWFVVSR